MSRAFVKEPDGSEIPDDRPRPVASGQPNYITPEGLDALRARRAALAASRAGAADPKSIDVQVAWLDERIRTALVVDPAPPADDEDAQRTVRFGARVTVQEEVGARRVFTIVGEDEADPAAGRISWVAPLAAAVLGAQVGDVVTWDRPAGAVDLEIVALEFPRGD